jgi:vitamin B12/bleomycin/antimicrobial peptide transport system ATP-binding/permease protein
MKIKTKKSFLDYLKEAFLMAKEYFIDSEENYKASFLLFLAIVCIIGMVGLSAAYSWWWVLFWAAFEAKKLNLFFVSMEIFTGISVTFIALKSAYQYLIGLIKLNWRNWFTQKLYNEYLEGNNNFLDISRAPEQLSHPAQRIHEDINYFVNLSVNLSLDFFKSILTQATFISTLWFIGGSLGLTVFSIHFVIPGYLVWIALSLALIATDTKQKLGMPLQKLNNQEANVEAEFRSELEYIPKESESISLENGQIYYKKSLTEKFQTIYETSYEKIKVNTWLAAFDSFYGQFSWVFPYLAATPIYFSGQIALGALMQIGFSFEEVNNSFSWFMNSFNDIAWFKTNIDRINELRNLIHEPKNSPSQVLRIQKHQKDSPSIMIDKLSIYNPKTLTPIAENLSFEFKPKENVIILGPSGLGKSTIFKAIAGTWKHGKGRISIPENQSLCFLAQRPSLPKNTLKQVLSYPKEVTLFNQADYESTLKSVGNMENFIPLLDQKRDWTKYLSGGQQQKIAFARVLLHKPLWLFLDESTASLDTESENKLYQLIKDHLPDTTFISIAHRESVKKFHDKSLTLRMDANGKMMIEENGLLTAPPLSA